MTTEDERRHRLPYWPAALRLDQASAYCGLSVDTFKKVCIVAPIQFTQSSHGRRWLRTRLDEWLDSLDPNAPQEPPRRRLADLIGGGAAQSETAATSPRANNKPRARRGGGWGYFATITDPKAIERYRAAGFEVYEDGELEELIKKAPMGKREIAALEGFFRARGEPADVKGAGLQITKRLIIRGYIKAAESHGEDKHRITPEGEAAWLAIMSDAAKE
jgi:hypothetical protein